MIVNVILFSVILLVILLVLVFVPIGEKNKKNNLNLYDSIKGLDKPLYKIHYKYLISPFLRDTYDLSGVYINLEKYDIIFYSLTLEENEYFLSLFKILKDLYDYLDQIPTGRIEEFVPYSSLEKIISTYNSILKVQYNRLNTLNNFIINEIFNNFINKESWFYFNNRCDIWEGHYDHLKYPKNEIPYFYKDNFEKIDILYKEFLINKSKVVKGGFLIDD